MFLKNTKYEFKSHFFVDDLRSEETQRTFRWIRYIVYNHDDVHVGEKIDNYDPINNKNSHHYMPTEIKMWTLIKEICECIG